MTVLDLMRHTAGFTYGFHNRTPVDAAYRTQRIAEMDTEGGLTAMIAQLAALPLEYSPAMPGFIRGERCGGLSDPNWFPGGTMPTLCGKNILTPGHARYRFFRFRKKKRDRFAACYTLKDGRLELFDDPSSWFSPPKLESGGGGLAAP